MPIVTAEHGDGCGCNARWSPPAPAISDEHDDSIQPFAGYLLVGSRHTVPIQLHSPNGHSDIPDRGRSVLCASCRLATRTIGRPDHPAILHARGTLRFAPATRRLAQAAMGETETKVGELCSELGISRMTLYRYVGPSGELREYARRVLQT